jgi:hypothetical protein
MGIAALSPLLGDWDARFEVVSGPDGVSGEALDSYRWLTGDKVLLHTTKGVLGGRPIEAVELFREDGDVIRSWSIMADGSATEATAAVASDTVEIDGDEARFRGRIETPDRIVGEWQRRDTGDWTTWMTMTLDRRA